MKVPLPMRFAAFAVVIAAGCRSEGDQAGWWQGEQERIELGHQVALKKFRYDQVFTDDFKDYDNLRRKVDVTSASLRALREQRLALVAEVESLQSQAAGFRESLIRGQRDRALGKKFEKLVLASGRSFENVSVAAIDDSGVTIRHADGSARLRYADLDAGQRIMFGLEEDLALAALEKEAKETAAYERWIDSGMASLGDKKAKDSEAARKEDLAALERRTRIAARELQAANASPLRQPATSFGRRSSSSYSSFSVYRPSYRYVYYDCTPSYNYLCRPVMPTASQQAARRGFINPVVIPPRRSFADTTLLSIP